MGVYHSCLVKTRKHRRASYNSLYKGFVNSILMVSILMISILEFVKLHHKLRIFIILFIFYFLLIQVVIYESGKPILKVESGTTLEVVKLLYGSESCTTDDNIIGVRPRSSASNGGIPCIVTLKDSKLEENAYDVITKGNLNNNLSSFHFSLVFYFHLNRNNTRRQ